MFINYFYLPRKVFFLLLSFLSILNELTRLTSHPSLSAQGEDNGQLIHEAVFSKGYNRTGQLAQEVKQFEKSVQYY